LVSFVLLAVAFAVREQENAKRLAGALEVSTDRLRQAEQRLAESYLQRGLALCEQNNVSQGVLWLARALQTAPAEAVDLRTYLRRSLAAWQSRQCPLHACQEHSAEVVAVAFSRNGSCITLSSDGSRYCWTVATAGRMANARPNPTEDRWVAAIGASTAVTGHTDGKVRRWVLPSFEPAGPPLAHSGPVTTLAQSDNGSVILVADSRGMATLWRMKDGSLRATDLPHEGEVRCVAISPDGKWALTAGQDRRAILWDVTSGRPGPSLQHDTPLGCAAFSQDGKSVVTGCDDGRVRLWETAGGKALDFHGRHASFVNSVAISSDGKLVLSGSDDKSARLWSLETQEPIGSPLLHVGAVKAVALSADGSRFLTGCSDRTARLWSVPAQEDVRLDVERRGWVRRVTFSPDGNMVLTGEGEFGKQGAGRLWDGRNGRLIGTPLVHTDLVWAAAFSADGTTVATAGADGIGRLADPRTRMAGPVLRHSSPISVVVFSPSGNLVLTGSEDRTAQLWEAKTGRRACLPLRHGGAVMAAEFSPAGDVFFTGTSDGGLSIWRTVDQVTVTRVQLTDSISRGTFSHDGKLLLVAAGKEVRLFDWSSGTFLGPPLTHQDRVRAIAFSHDDQVILTAGDDGAAKLWDAHTCTPQGATFSHPLGVAAAVFSPDSRLVLTGSADGMARLWDVGTGRSVGPPLPHRGKVVTVAFSPDGGRFATGSSGGTCRVWKTPAPLEGEAPTLLERCEVLTGMELDNEGPRFIGAAAWQERYHHLQQAEGAQSP
jgi:WD40 repeat protein